MHDVMHAPVIAHKAVRRAVCPWSPRYESGKALVPEGHGMLGDMAVGVWAQLVAGVVYTPIDIVKERLQVLPAQLHGCACWYVWFLGWVHVPVRWLFCERI